MNKEINEEYENIHGLGIKPITKAKAVQLYKNMRTRCYNPSFHKTRPSYAVCTICDEWLEDRTKFYEWVYENYYTVGSEQMQLDKDILVKGNKVYSPSTCIFVPRSINSLFENSAAIRGDCPVGITYDKNLKKYRGYLSVNGRSIKLHSWNTPEEAFAEYKQHKEALIMATADKYKGKIPIRLYNAMINWKVEITD